jgi:hypothetical protein
MPQPLNRVNRAANILFGGGAVATDPRVGVLPMVVISVCSNMDGQLTELLQVLLKAGSLRVVTALYQAVQSQTARNAALKAAAEKALRDPEQLRMWRAVMKAIKPVFDHRDAFAHGAWGTSPDIPDALLLADPRLFTQSIVDHLEGGREDHERARLAFQRAREQGMPPEQAAAAVPRIAPGEPIDRSEIQVWTRADLEAEARAALEGSRWLMELRIYLSAGIVVVAQQFHDRLLNAPPIRQAYDNLVARERLPSEGP